jgi:hypothetical protein
VWLGGFRIREGKAWLSNAKRILMKLQHTAG